MSCAVLAAAATGSEYWYAIYHGSSQREARHSRTQLLLGPRTLIGYVQDALEWATVTLPWGCQGFSHSSPNVPKLPGPHLTTMYKTDNRFPL